jgi:hypothetical protein
MSLLTIIQDAATELKLVKPATVIGSTDPNAPQLLALANKEGKELARRFDWQALTKEATFATVASETQTTLSAIGASDFDHIVNETMWNRTQNWRVLGPLNPDEWQRKKASAAQAAIGNWFRIRGDAILFYPTPAAGENIYFEYVSSKWCQSSGGTAQSSWAADTDTALINEEIIRLGIIWRFRKAKGFDYGEDFRTYEAALENEFGADSGSAAIDMTGEPEMLGTHLPEGSWNL